MAQQSINQILLNLRENHNLKQKDVAAILGISQQTYSNYERGKREIPVHLLKPLAEFYSISLDFMLHVTPPSASNVPNNEYVEGLPMSQLICDLVLLSPDSRNELVKYLKYLKQINP